MIERLAAQKKALHCIERQLLNASGSNADQQLIAASLQPRCRSKTCNDHRRHRQESDHRRQQAEPQTPVTGRLGSGHGRRHADTDKATGHRTSKNDRPPVWGKPAH